MFSKNLGYPAFICNSKVYCYQQLMQEWDYYLVQLAKLGVTPRSTVSLEGALNLQWISLFLALAENKNVIVPISTGNSCNNAQQLETAQVETRLVLNSKQQIQTLRLSTKAQHELIAQLSKDQRAGLILFSSGTSGKPKAALHDLSRLLAKYLAPRRASRIIGFLQHDHMGGLNTTLHCLFNAGTLILPDQRTPASICSQIEAHKAEVLPTTPSFLNLLIVSKEWNNYDLNSLKLITYGTEAMPSSTLDNLIRIFPGVKLLQTYGLSELGILPTRSLSNDSLLMQIGGTGHDIRVVNGLLEIKSSSAMLGYLNEPSPFTSDGWYCTGDAVEVQGDHLRILGRKSDLINVAGQKVFPSEIESVLQEIAGVEEVKVFGEPHHLLGQIVVAQFKLRDVTPIAKFRAQVREFCKTKLEAFKIPQRIELIEHSLLGPRYKKLRAGSAVDYCEAALSVD